MASRQRDLNEAVLTISFRGVRKTERMMQFYERTVRQEVELTVQDIGDAAVSILQAYAPERTGNLKDSIRVTGRNRSGFMPNVRVGGNARSVSDPAFNYLPITRFGRGPVRAKRSSRPARTYNTRHEQFKGIRGVQNRPWRASFLRFEPGPPGTGFIYKKEVGPFKPAGDWVAKAEKVIRVGAQKAVDDLTDEIIDAWERSGFDVPSKPQGKRPGARKVTVRRTRSTR